MIFFLSILYVLARKSTPLALLTPLGESSRIGFLPPQTPTVILSPKLAFKVSTILGNLCSSTNIVIAEGSFCKLMAFKTSFAFKVAGKKSGIILLG